LWSSDASEAGAAPKARSFTEKDPSRAFFFEETRLGFMTDGFNEPSVLFSKEKKRKRK
jgi:hypothetical protein